MTKSSIESAAKWFSLALTLTFLVACYRVLAMLGLL